VLNAEERSARFSRWRRLLSVRLAQPARRLCLSHDRLGLGRSLAIGDCPMIACACTSSSDREAGPAEVEFESILPGIQRCATNAFRRIRPSLREDLIAEAIANAYVAFARLVERGLTSLIYPTALAKFAVGQVRDGRRIGCRR